MGCLKPQPLRPNGSFIQVTRYQKNPKNFREPGQGYTQGTYSIFVADWQLLHHGAVDVAVSGAAAARAVGGSWRYFRVHGPEMKAQNVFEAGHQSICCFIFEKLYSPHIYIH